MISLARRVGCTEGQLYTIVIGFVAAVALLAIGIPPVLRDEPSVAAAPVTSSTTTTSTTAVAPVVAAVSAPTTSIPPSPSVTARPSSSEAPAPSAAPAPTPRAVLDAGYTSSTSGTPLSGPEVPDDGMPVGVRFGEVDKMSFARLTGTAPVLTLALVDDPAANHFVAFAVVRACAITESGWSLSEPGADPSEAPPFDSDGCVDGVAMPDGTWAFDLGELDVANGIALVPVSEGPATFQVTFSTEAVVADPAV